VAAGVGDGNESIVIDRVFLKKVKCLSWDEEGYKFLYDVNEGERVLRAYKYAKGLIRRGEAIPHNSSRLSRRLHPC
jgi:hypothetical protein